MFDFAFNQRLIGIGTGFKVHGLPESENAIFCISVN